VRHVLKPAFSLFVVAALAAVSLAVVYGVMSGPIAENERRARERMLREILTEATEFEETAVPPETSDPRIRIERVFAGFRDGEAVGYVVELVTGAGYGGDIAMMVGISGTENRVAGMRVLRHSETPGFGAVISRESFFRRFDGIGLVRLVVGSGEDRFQAITSSTITTHAVVNAVNEAIDWYYRHVGGER